VTLAKIFNTQETQISTSRYEEQFKLGVDELILLHSFSLTLNKLGSLLISLHVDPQRIWDLNPSTSC
jgi:hypothetical protein